MNVEDSFNNELTSFLLVKLIYLQYVYNLNTEEVESIYLSNELTELTYEKKTR
jgi:hypothetical protein